ncbi:unnamed protein product [Chondrus crispus]|uniref:Uncharacterized protein n=1 Tax=Chondrus crispus TaxID=2769 RepID=R7Q5K1_CHOCR|nr:unnamed protein product [Chondrus crispus]CDF32651.1 unnamed protein product [Chondrus crispus]|eukprot:XP_005712422.1 unnamed protein product [Chondrus crispus]
MNIVREKRGVLARSLVHAPILHGNVCDVAQMHCQQGMKSASGRSSIQMKAAQRSTGSDIKGLACCASRMSIL